MDYSEFQAKKSERNNLNQAAVRGWGVWITHLFFAPVASVVYSAKTNYWMPTIVATGIGLVGVPLAVIDLGLTLGVVAPVTSAGMIVSNSMKRRNELQIISPEEADYKITQLYK